MDEVTKNYVDSTIELSAAVKRANESKGPIHPKHEDAVRRISQMSDERTVLEQQNARARAELETSRAANLFSLALLNEKEAEIEKSTREQNALTDALVSLAAEKRKLENENLDIRTANATLADSIEAGKNDRNSMAAKLADMLDWSEDIPIQEYGARPASRQDLKVGF